MTSSFYLQPLSKSELHFEDGIKEGEGDLYDEDKTGFIKYGPPWSIIGLHSDNVRHDAPVWSRILPSLILFKEVTITNMLYLKVTRRRTLPVWSRILPSPILFKKVTATENPCSLDDFLMAKYSIKRRITALSGRRVAGPNPSYGRKGTLKGYSTS